MNIAIITPDFSSNCLGRSYLLAQLLQRYHRVSIIGPIFKNEVWFPLAKVRDVPFLPIQTPLNLTQFILRINRIIKKIKGEVIYITKPLITSYGPALIAKKKFKLPLILDIDDWEMAPFKEKNILQKYLQALYHINNPFSFFPCAVMDKYIARADLITVSSNSLKKMYGGLVVPHLRKVIPPKPGMKSSKKTVLFLGTPRPHKGLKELIEAFNLIPYNNVVLQIVGFDKKSAYCQELKASAKRDKRIQFQDQVRFDKIPEYMAGADIVVIPQKYTSCGQTQLPAKLFDAMASGRAIIATRVSDIPEIIGDAGVIVEPNNTAELKNAMMSLLDSPEKIRELGKKAKERYRKFYSFDKMSQKLNDYILSNLNV